VLTVLLTSPRVAAGLLRWEAWSALRSASRVLAGSADHPQLPALAAAGVDVEVVEAPPDVPSLAALLSSAALAARGPVIWLAPSGENSDAGLASAATVPVTVLPGSHDLPGAHLLDVVAVMDTLRTSCPWDKQQTHESLMRYLLEEAYETVETVESGDLAALREELGDVLFQAVFNARIAAERPSDEGGFTIDDVADTLVTKLIRRHPHVFSDVSVSSADEVNRNWEEIKKIERSERHAATGGGAPSVFDGVAFGQPALSLAAQLQRRAERAGFPVDAGLANGAVGEVGAVGAVSEVGEVGEVGAVGAVGEVGAELMRLVARARAAGTDPELALRAVARRFAERVRDWERSAEGSPPAD
jgi:XTP/dITP diphosphohydrolase